VGGNDDRRRLGDGGRRHAPVETGAVSDLGVLGHQDGGAGGLAGGFWGGGGAGGSQRVGRVGGSGLGGQRGGGGCPAVGARGGPGDRAVARRGGRVRRAEERLDDRAVGPDLRVGARDGVTRTRRAADDRGLVQVVLFQVRQQVVEHRARVAAAGRESPGHR